MQNLAEHAKEIRKNIFIASQKGGGAHLGGCFSCVEILTALYMTPLLKYRASEPCWSGRDIFILSKGHAGLALYAALAQAGFFDKGLLKGFCQPGSQLGTHPKIDEPFGVEMSSGALGHGLGFGLGQAFAGKRVCVLLGDGECQEGSVWEGAMFAGHHKLSSMTAIVDYNKLQAMDRLSNIIGLEPLVNKWESFGWNVIETDGHDFAGITNAWTEANAESEKPSVIIAHTVKGKGVSLMENVPLWHVRAPSNEAEMKTFCNELDIKEEELK